MRKFLIPLAAAAASAGIAAPAAAQWFPQPVGPAYGYHAPAYGYHNYGRANFGHARALQARVDHLQREISRLARFRMISPREYRNLRAESREIERRLRRNARDGWGLSPQEAYSIERRIARLEYRLARDVRDGRRFAYRW